MTDQTTIEQQMMLEEVQSQVAERTLTRFDHEDARRIGSAAAALAERDHLPIVVAVSRGTQRVLHAAFAGTTAEHDDWVRRKINTAMRHEIPSLEFVLRHQLSGHAPDWLDQREFAIAGGAVPILVAGITVGAIAISGLVGSIREDHDLAMDAIRSVRSQP
jgi:uncharacterized protein (UPF0303 family)